MVAFVAGLLVTATLRWIHDKYPLDGSDGSGSSGKSPGADESSSGLPFGSGASTFGAPVGSRFPPSTLLMDPHRSIDPARVPLNPPPPLPPQADLSEKSWSHSASTVPA